MRHAEIWESFRALKKYQSMAPPIRPNPGTGPKPLSFSQDRLWMLHQLNPGAADFNVPYAFRVTGPLDAEVLARSIGEIRRRHEILRTTFTEETGGQTMQAVQEATPFSLPLVDLSTYSPEEKERKVASLIDEEAGRPFDISTGPLFRSELLRLDPGDHVFMVTFHHIVFDAWSDGIFFKELDELYKAYSLGEPSPLKELTIQYADFAEWQHEWVSSGSLDVLLQFWTDTLTEIPAQNFPADFPRLTKGSAILGRKTHLFPESVSGSLKALTAEEGMTDFIVLLAAFYVLLSTYLEADDIYVCAPVANRSRTEIQKLIGYFVNFVIYRADLSGDISFRELLGRVCKVSSGVYSHQEMPIQELINRLNLYHLPLSQIMFSVQNADRYMPKLGGLNVVPLDEQRGVDFDVFLEIEELKDGLLLNLRYNADLFKSSTMEDLVNDYQAIVKAATENPDRKVSTLLTLGDSRKSQWREKLKAQSEKAGMRDVSPGDYVAPRDPLELQITQLWESLLGRSRIGVTDNFFELGGKSLIALQMVSQIQEALGKSLPVSALAEAQTIEQIASLLRREEAPQASSPIVALQPRGSKPPLFVLQPAASTALHFADLARHLAPDQPVYGFEQEGMDGTKPPHQTVEEMAAYYIREMKTISPNGPYLLLGRCMGGIVAYQMALQLQGQNESIAFLGILDTQSPPRLEGRDARYYISEFFSRIFHYLKSGTLISATFGRILRKARRRKSKDSGDRRIQFVMDTHARARRHYIPATQFRGVLKIFKNKEASLKAQAGWAKLATQGLDIIETAGGHGTMLEEQNIDNFITELKSVLQKSLNRPG